MHRTLYAASAIALMIGFIGSAHAATLAAPPAGSIRIYQAIEEMDMTVQANSANLRDQPADSGKILDRLPRGTKVTVIEKVTNKRDWARVKVGTKEGYINLKLLK
jgi:uncharacterized protein YgiM (DUF1202 family)